MVFSDKTGADIFDSAIIQCAGGAPELEQTSVQKMRRHDNNMALSAGLRDLQCAGTSLASLHRLSLLDRLSLTYRARRRCRSSRVDRNHGWQIRFFS